MTQQNMDNMELTKGSFASIMTNIEERMSIFEAELQKSTKTTNTTPTLVNLAADFTSFKLFVLNTINAFKLQVESLAQETDDIEMRSRRKMLLFHGIAEQRNEDTLQLIVGICKEDLRLHDIKAEDIRRCHRMGRVAGQKSRPILVKFSTVAARDKVWFSKAKLKGTGKTLSEFLTRRRHEVFMAARERFGVTKCWSREGHIYILDSDGAQKRIRSFAELNRISVDKPKTPAASKPVASKPKRGATMKK